MRLRGLLLGLVLACLAPGCSDEKGSGLAGTAIEVVPPFEYSLYLTHKPDGRPEPIPGTDEVLARRPAHLERIYLNRKDAPEARVLFEWLEGQCRLRPSLERPPTGVPASEALWRDYVTYWERRFGELSRPDAGSPRPPPPLTWEGYRLFRTRFVRAMEFQQSFSARLRRELSAQASERRMGREMKRPRMDENLGLRPEDGDAITYVDQFVVDEATLGQDTPRVESFSTKQRDFTRMNEDGIKKHVLADSREALGKYGGTVEVRRPSHPLFERQVTVSRVHLVYDEGLLPNLPNVKQLMESFAVESGVELHFHHER
jgi:hypothetical protein